MGERRRASPEEAKRKRPSKLKHQNIGHEFRKNPCSGTVWGKIPLLEMKMAGEGPCLAVANPTREEVTDPAGATGPRAWLFFSAPKESLSVAREMEKIPSTLP